MKLLLLLSLLLFFVVVVVVVLLFFKILSTPLRKLVSKLMWVLETKYLLKQGLSGSSFEGGFGKLLDGMIFVINSGKEAFVINEPDTT